jgi:ABC-2 type transport system permease protein
VLSGVIISLIGLVTVLITASVILSIPGHLIVLIAITSLLGIVFTSFTGVIIDLFHPKLNWDNEQKAVKQNLNPVLNMLLVFTFAGLTIWGAVAFKFNAFTAFGIIILAFGIIDFVLYRFIASKGVKMFNGIEV